MKTNIWNLVHTTRFWNNIHQAPPSQKIVHVLDIYVYATITLLMSLLMNSHLQFLSNIIYLFLSYNVILTDFGYSLGLLVYFFRKTFKLVKFSIIRF